MTNVHVTPTINWNALDVERKAARAMLAASRNLLDFLPAHEAFDNSPGAIARKRFRDAIEQAEKAGIK